jgi:hypothetical protein
MHPRQLALIEDAVGAVAAECVRSPVATLNAGHLRALLVEHMLRAGVTIVERGATAAERRLVRLVDDVVQIEQDAREPRTSRGRAPRPPDLRVGAPVVLGIDLWARSAMAPDRQASARLHERLAALADGHADLLLLACDRRAYDALRVERRGADGEPAALPRLCAVLLPASASLDASMSVSSATLGARRWGAGATITPMVFGAQRVVVALWAAKRPGTDGGSAAQLDAFD